MSVRRDLARTWRGPMAARRTALRAVDKLRTDHDDAGVRYRGHLPFEGEIIWLTPEQGGRASGPPPTPLEQDYAATAFVPPHTVQRGLASFFVRAEDRTAWRSRAAAGWLVVDNTGDQAVGPDTMIVITEGPRTVAYFHVEQVRPDPLPAALRALNRDSLVGRTEDDARRQVEAAGGVLRTYDADHPALTLDYVPVRITARAEAGRVIEVHGFG